MSNNHNHSTDAEPDANKDDKSATKGRKEEPDHEENPDRKSGDGSGEEHKKHHDHDEHHQHMLEDFRRRFIVSIILTVPILVLSPMIQGWLGLREAISFPGDNYVQLALATAVFLYGGWPFLKGVIDELKEKQPGMMTLIALAICVAYGYSAVVALGLSGRVFFWELATLVDVMLLGHWIEMRSVMGAKGALKELVKLMPSEAHRKTNGDVEDVSIDELEAGDRVLANPARRFRSMARWSKATAASMNPWSPVSPLRWKSRKATRWLVARSTARDR